MTYQEIADTLIDKEYTVSMVTEKGDVQWLEVYCSALIGDVRLKEVRDILPEEFKSHFNPNREVIVIEKT